MIVSHGLSHGLMAAKGGGLPAPTVVLFFDELFVIKKFAHNLVQCAVNKATLSNSHKS